MQVVASVNIPYVALVVSTWWLLCSRPGCSDGLLIQIRADNSDDISSKFEVKSPAVVPVGARSSSTRPHKFCNEELASHHWCARMCAVPTMEELCGAVCRMSDSSCAEMRNITGCLCYCLKEWDCPVTGV